MTKKIYKAATGSGDRSSGSAPGEGAGQITKPSGDTMLQMRETELDNGIMAQRETLD